MQGDDKLQFLRNKNRSEQERVLRADLNRRPDVLWQENPPRVLAYKPQAVHQYGWIPFNPFNTRNFKATVFSSPLLNVQTVILVAWAAFLHATGCWVEAYDARAFLKIWGTVFAGAVFNLATIVVFILGLFITLVINRWWSIRTAHAKLVSASSDLTIMVAHSIRDAQDFKNPRVMAARRELVRLINLAHILVCISGDGANHVFAQRPITKALGRLFQRRPKQPSGGDDNVFGRHMGSLGFQALHRYGLVNADEWQTILTNDAYGMPRYVTVMYWVEALLHQCRASEYMLTPQQMLPPMLAKVSTIVDNASTIFTFLRSQLPYPYVHLVSFTVHFYLFFWATYMGMLLYTGIPDGSVSQSAPTQPLGVGTSADGAWDLVQASETVTTAVRHAHRADGWFNMLWTYMTIAFANVVFQGLLNIHVLLDNPFGDHCSKFPLRSHVVELLNSSRTLLARADMLPAMFSDIFGDGEPPAAAGLTPASAGADSRGPVSSEASFPGPTAAHGPRVDSVSDLGRLSEQDLAAVAGALIQGAPPPQLLSTGGRSGGAQGGSQVGGGLASPFQPGQVTQRMLYEVGGPGLRQAPDNGVEAAPDCLMRRSASASPYASVSDFQADTYTQANMGPPKKPMLQRLSAPFRFGTSQSSGPVSSSVETSPKSRATRGKSLLRNASRKARPAGAAPRVPGQQYVHFQPTAVVPPHIGNPAEDSSEVSQGEALSGGSPAPQCGDQPPQPRSPAGSAPSGPSGRSGSSPPKAPALWSSDARGGDTAHEAPADAAPAGDGRPLTGASALPGTKPAELGGIGPSLAHVTRKQVEGGVVAEARVQRPKYGKGYGSKHKPRRSRSAEHNLHASVVPTAADSVHLRVPPGTAVQRAVQASRPAQPGGPDMDAPPPPPADAEPSEYSATVAIDRTSFSRSPQNDVGHGRDNGSSHGGGIHAEAAGRRWFSMFARRTASMRTSSSEGVLLTSSAPVLGSMHADEPAAGALIGMSSDVAQRRVGTQAVFNPSAHVNEDDAQFLRGTPALSAGSVEVPLEEIREAAQPSGSPGLARSSELADISGSGTQSSLSLPIDKRQVLPSTQKRL